MPAPRHERSRGPFTAEGLREEGRYELSNGHPVYCQPSGGQHAGSNLTGGLPLATDPEVEEAGVDAGFTTEPGTVRAPDIAVGNVPMRPGWVKGSPPLAVEYADSGTDETELQTKIGELIAAGTRFVWVVRLVGPRRVEVYEHQKPLRVALPGTELAAPGVLRNALPVEALFDRNAALHATLKNLLQREGYESLDDVKAEGREEGRVEGREEGREKGREEGREEGARRALRTAIEALCTVLELPFSDDRRRELEDLDASGLSAVMERLRSTRRW